MAILKNTVQVNNGNSGWNSSHVLDALEETFGDLGWNSGAQANGVVTTCFPPGSDTPWKRSEWSSAWETAGGQLASVQPIREVRYFVTDDSVNETFAFRKAWYFTSGNENLDGSTGDYINVYDHGFSDGDEFLYYQGISNRTGANNHLFTGAANGQSVFVSVSTADRLHLYASNADAIAGTNKINIAALSSGYYLTTTTTQTTIDDINMEDTITFVSYDTTLSTDMRFQDQAGAINAQRELNSTNYQSVTYKAFPDHTRMDVGADLSTSWHTRAWTQGTYYITGDAATYSTPFNILPQGGQHYVISGIGTGQHNEPYRPAYWDYTVPQDGSRSALNLRVYRRGTGSLGRLYGIEVLDLNSSGWADGDTFTIPGDQVGGETPANDIVFGVNTPETGSNLRDGISSISVQNFGAGVNSYLKLPVSKKLILRLENDANKAYGVTYYTFNIQIDDYNLKMDSFIDPDFRNYYPGSSSETEIGRKGGHNNLDYPSATGINFAASSETSYAFTGSATPTAYPLRIVTYRAQSPQDGDFSIIQFIQTVNGIDIPKYTFSLPKGTQYGQNVYDLDYVWQGFYTQFSTGIRRVLFDVKTPAYHSYESNNVGYGASREALYGYTRDYNDTSGGLLTTYASNRWTDNNMDGQSVYYGNTNNDHVFYFRDSTYDRQKSSRLFSGTRQENINDFNAATNLYAVSDSADYDRVIKSLPLSDCASPRLYTLPEDFVMIDFNFTPGATTFLVGDTITISASEIYEVILPSFTTDASTYDGITNNSVHGILFCARTT
jgi:hypothetical protein